MARARHGCQKKIGDMQAPPDTFRRGIDWAMPTLLRIEKLVQPRLQFLTQKPATIWFGIQTLILAAILTLPIPFGNWPPGMSVATLAIALLQRDGLFAIISFIFFIASIIIAPLGVGMAIAALNWAAGTIGDWARMIFGG
ncbi:MAG: exopolysaccharide biosynthesis protein [Hyphomonadaceae bacterium]|nr:exopolysaccharide biosynthesis protein [Hyphomonadaceae bacterium]